MYNSTPWDAWAMGDGIPSLAERIRPGMTVVDAGANIGLYTLIFADLVGRSGRVISFEPDPDMFAANLAGDERLYAARR